MAGWHQIRNLSFEIETNSEASAKDDIQTLESLIKRRLLSTIEKVFDDLALEGATLRIDALTLDLGLIDIYQIDSEVEYKLRHALQDQLKTILEAEPEVMQQFQASLEPEIKKTEEWLQIYITTGLIPWWKQVHQLSRQDITEEIHRLFQSSPAQFRRFIFKNISSPQVLKRLLVYTNYSFIKEVIGFDVAALEQMVKATLDFINQSFTAANPTYTQVFNSVVQRLVLPPGTKRNMVEIAEAVVSEVILQFQKLNQLAEQDAKLLLFFYTRQTENLPELKQSISSRFKTTRYSKASLVVLDTKTASLIGKKIWLIDRLIEENDFVSLSQQKAFRVNFINALSKEEKLTVWKALLPKEIQQYILTLTEWTSFLRTSLNLSKTAQQKLEIFTQDSVIIQLTKQWKSNDQQELLKVILLFAAEIIAETALDVIATIKFKQITEQAQFKTEKHTQWKVFISEFSDALEEDERKQNPAITADNWAEEAIQFLLKGRSAFARSVSGATFKEKIAEAINYFLGGTKSEESWQDSSYYRGVLQRNINQVSVLEIALIIERLYQLQLPRDQKEALLKIIFDDHSLAKIILSEDNVPAVNWMATKANLNFSFQYLLKFNRLPLSITLNPEQFIRLASLLFEDEIKTMVAKLSVTSLNQLLLLLEKLNAKPIKSEELQTIQYLVEASQQKPSKRTTSKSVSGSAIQLATQTIYSEIKEKLSQEWDKIEISKKTEKQKDKNPIEVVQLDKELDRLAEKELENSLYVQNSGIVLLAPYLPKVFERLALLNEEGIFKNEESKIKAVEVIHFLTFGTEEMMEYTTILNKLMVAMPVSTPLKTKISLTVDDKALCESLLKGVLQNWPSLMSSSIDNLRGTFLIREGKLTSHEDKYLLKVEEKGFDMLIDKVPWSFKLVKYKWMKKPIFVEWR